MLHYITYGTYKVKKSFNYEEVVLDEGDILKVVDIWQGERAVCFKSMDNKAVILSYDKLDEYVEIIAKDNPKERAEPIFNGLKVIIKKLLKIS